MFERPAEIDRLGVRWVRKLPHPAGVTRGLAGLSLATDHSDAWLLVGLGGALLDEPRRDRWLGAAGRVALVELSVRAIKRMLPRARPQFDDLPPLASTPSSMSFPSSHTAAAVAAIRGFEGLIPTSALWLVAIVSAFSRLYLGVHFPSDVAVGAGLGRLLSRRRR